TLGNYSPPSKLCSTLLLLLQLPTSLLIPLLPFLQRKWQPSGTNSTNCLLRLRAQPSMPVGSHTISPTVLPSITQVINASFTIFPSSFKVAQVTPLLKKPSLDPTQVENYRPVSILTLLSKTIERAASKQVTEFLSRNNLLDPNQSGFKSGQSTETALFPVTEALKTARATVQSSALILLDLSAAFDSQPL